MPPKPNKAKALASVREIHSAKVVPSTQCILDSRKFRWPPAQLKAWEHAYYGEVVAANRCAVERFTEMTTER
jgi:hypothetical protein